MIQSVLNYIEYRKRKHRKYIMQHNIEYLEMVDTREGRWASDINTLIRILEKIDDRVLEEADLTIAANISFFSGFIDSNHVLDWATNIRNDIHNGVPLGEDAQGIVYKRQTRTLNKFIIANGRYATTIVGFKKQLHQMLVNIQIELSSLSDPRTKHRETTIVNTVSRDLFAIVEAIIAWGVYDE